MLSPFDSLEVQDKIEVTITKGNSYKAEIIAGKNIVKNINCKVVKGQLVITNNNTCNFVRGYKHSIKVHVVTPYLKKCFHNGVGPVNFDANFSQDVITLRIENSGDVHLNGTFSKIYSSSHGNGDLYLKGKTSQLHLYTNGTNYIWGNDLEVSDYVYVENLSLGDVTLNLNGVEVFDYQIWDDGNVNYKGNPAIIHHPGLKGEGKGQLKKLD